TLASSQFGPRLLRNFTRDKGNQVVLGTFVATFLYCLLVLRTIHSALYSVPAMIAGALLSSEHIGRNAGGTCSGVHGPHLVASWQSGRLRTWSWCCCSGSPASAR